jgi:hypothetical protein
MALETTADLMYQSPAAVPSSAGAPTERSEQTTNGGVTLSHVISNMLAELMPTSRKEGFEPPPLLRRVRLQLSQNGPRLKTAAVSSFNHSRDWVVQGGTFRILLALAVLSIAGCAAAGSLLFGLVLTVATVHALLVAFVLCLAAAASFLAMVLAALSAVYVSVLVTSAAVIGFLTLVAVSSAFGMSLLTVGLYLAYQAISIGIQYTFAKSKPSRLTSGSRKLEANHSRLKET